MHVQEWRAGGSLLPLELKRLCLKRGASLCGEEWVADKNITRMDLADAVYRTAGLSRPESAELVEQVIREICDTLARGENVKLSGFGVFTVCDKAERVGRNPKTGVEAPIQARRSITLSASPGLKAYLNGGK
jgi:integration host factor subunit alpha